MDSSVVPADEEGRLAAIRRYAILDTPADGAFDRIAGLAARFFGVPIATVSIVDRDRIWFKARHGLEQEEIPRDPGLCSSVVLSDNAYVLSDARVDPRALNNPLVAGDFGLRFYAAAPIVTHDGYRLGTVNVIGKEPREVTDIELETLKDLAALVTDELELRLAARRTIELEREIRERAVGGRNRAEGLAKRLQLMYLPPPLPPVPGFELAVFYQSADEGFEAGGDFYDAFETGDGRWALVIGDICGKGVEAAALMNIVRHDLRALAQTCSRPSQVLRYLNDLLLTEDLKGNCCTIVFALVQSRGDRRVLTVCSAGHPLPLVCHPDGSVERLGQWSTILGAIPNPSLTDFECELGPGDILFMYTDGLAERPGADPGLAELRLESALSRAQGGDAATILEQVTRHAPGELRDDVAALVARVVPPI